MPPSGCTGKAYVNSSSRTAIVQQDCNRPNGFVQRATYQHGTRRWDCNRPNGFARPASHGLDYFIWICATSLGEAGLFQSNWIYPDRACVLHRSIGHIKPRIQPGLLHNPVQIGWTIPAKTGKCPHWVQKYFMPCPEKFIKTQDSWLVSSCYIYICTIIDT